MNETPAGQETSDLDAFPVDETDESSIEQVARNTSRKLLVLLALGAGLLVLVHATPLGDYLRNWDALAALFKAGGIRAEVFFVLINALLIIVGTPRLLLCGLAGFAFGFWQGVLWSSVGSLLGSFVAFRAARWGGRAWLTERFGHRRFFGRIVHAKPTVASVALLRLLPVSNAIVNVGLALSRVRNRAFLIGSLIGFLPQGVVAVIVGSGMAQDVPWAGAVQIGLAGVLMLIVTFWSSKKIRKPS